MENYRPQLDTFPATSLAITPDDYTCGQSPIPVNGVAVYDASSDPLRPK